MDYNQRRVTEVTRRVAGVTRRQIAERSLTDGQRRPSLGDSLSQKKKATYDNQECLLQRDDKYSQIGKNFPRAYVNSWSMGWAGEKEGCCTEVLSGFK